MIKILCLLALGILACRADAPNDKFDLSVMTAEIHGNSLVVAFRVINKSEVPIKLDLSTAVVVMRTSLGKGEIQVEDVATRPGIYKPRITLIVPTAEQIFFTPRMSRAFAPQVVKPGETFTLSKDIQMNPAGLLKDIAVNPYSISLSLAFQTADKPQCQSTPPSPTYKMTLGAEGKMNLEVPPAAETVSK